MTSTAEPRPEKGTRLDLGAPAAERDIKKGLVAYFIESEAFQRVQRGEKLVVVGTRGAGKSAIFQVLAQRERAAGTYVIELWPEDYSYELLHRSMLSEQAGSWAKLGAYAAAWKYLIYVLVMLELTSKGMRKKEAASIYRYVRDHHVGGAAGKLSALVSYVKRIEGIKVGSFDASLRTRELEKLYKLGEIAPLLPTLKQVLESQRVVVLVDELDRGWDQSEDAKAFVAGLFQACTTLNELSDNLRVYISLRQELYDNIPALYEDAQKYRDLIEVISWTKPRLLELIAARIRYSLRSPEEHSDQRCWTKYLARDRRTLRSAPSTTSSTERCCAPARSSSSPRTHSTRRSIVRTAFPWTQPRSPKSSLPTPRSAPLTSRPNTAFSTRVWCGYLKRFAGSQPAYPMTSSRCCAWRARPRVPSRVRTLVGCETKSPTS
jgi:hypothetical protein